MLKYLVLIGAAINLVGVYAYVRDTIRGETQPNRVTWLMWTIAPMIATVAALSEGVRWAVIPVFMSGFCPLLVFLSSFVNKKAYWKLERFDYLCGFFSLIALVLWGITKDASVAIVFAILSDLSAAIPTLVKLVRHPESETVGPFTTGLISCLTSFAAIPSWTFSQYAFPVYLVGMNSALIVSFYWKRIVDRNRPTSR